MDDNKLKKLQDIKYVVRKTCDICEHSNIYDGHHFGICLLHQYEHLKHSDAKRHMSIHVSGYCDKFDLCPGKAQRIVSNFSEFIEK